MPKFHVKDTFEVPDRGLFVLAGSIVDGIVRSGMFVHLGFFAEPTTAVPKFLWFLHPDTHRIEESLLIPSTPRTFFPFPRGTLR